MSTLNDLLTYAFIGTPAYNCDDINELTEFIDRWSGLLNTPLEDLHLSRLDLDGMEKDFLSISGYKC